MAIIDIFSDLHLHAFREFAETLATGVNSRLQDGLDALEAIMTHANDKADVLVFAGDWYHKRRLLEVRAHNEAHDRLVLADLPTYLMRGNHDHATRDGGVHSIHAFRSVTNVHVVDSPGVMEVHPGVWVNFIPYMDDAEAIKKALRAKRPKGAKTFLCIGHFGVLGAVTGPTEYVPLEPITPDDLPDGVYDFGFLGHYHRRQKIKKGWWYIGSPMQTSRGERGEDKGFLVYDTEQPGKFMVKPLRLPEFVTLEAEDIERGGFKEKVKGNFVDAVLDEEPECGVEEFKALLKKLGARGANVVCAPRPKVETKRLDVHPGLSPVEMVEKYIEEYGTEINEEEALAFAKECLEKAEKVA